MSQPYKRYECPWASFRCGLFYSVSHRKVFNIVQGSFNPATIWIKLTSPCRTLVTIVKDPTGPSPLQSFLLEMRGNNENCPLLADQSSAENSALHRHQCHSNRAIICAPQGASQTVSLYIENNQCPSEMLSFISVSDDLPRALAIDNWTVEHLHLIRYGSVSQTNEKLDSKLEG